MIGRLRQVVSGWAVMVFACLFLLLEGPVLYWEWKIGQPIVDLTVRPGTILLYLAAGLYGIHRAISLHPFFREDYRKWLELTPWTVHKPLPMGPIALIWEDGIVLGTLILLNLTQHTHHSIRILNVFLITHSLLLATTFWPTGVGAIGYLALFGLGLTVRTLTSPWPCFAVAATVYLLVHEGTWLSLARFPWHLKSELNGPKTRGERLLGPTNGWPYDRFFRDIKEAEQYRISRIDSILVSMLVGWWTSCLLPLFPDPGTRLGAGILALLVMGLFAVFGRLQIYMSLYRCPISLWGRLLTGRWIIPGYDRCLVGPLLSLLAVPAVILPCLAARIPPDIFLPTTLSAVILVNLITPPALKEWRLTGKHRILEGQFYQRQDSEFTRVG